MIFSLVAEDQLFLKHMVTARTFGTVAFTSLKAQGLSSIYELCTMNANVSTERENR